MSQPPLCRTAGPGRREKPGNAHLTEATAGVGGAGGGWGGGSYLKFLTSTVKQMISVSCIIALVRKHSDKNYR